MMTSGSKSVQSQWYDGSSKHTSFACSGISPGRCETRTLQEAKGWKALRTNLSLAQFENRCLRMNQRMAETVRFASNGRVRVLHHHACATYLALQSRKRTHLSKKSLENHNTADFHCFSCGQQVVEVQKAAFALFLRNAQ